MWFHLEDGQGFSQLFAFGKTHSPVLIVTDAVQANGLAGKQRVGDQGNGHFSTGSIMVVPWSSTFTQVLVGRTMKYPITILGLSSNCKCGEFLAGLRIRDELASVGR
jgi:hypothetical protein